MSWDAGDGRERDFTPPGLWARLTAEPRPGWYSWRAVAPASAGGWTLLPADAGSPSGVAGATAGADRLPARGANAEAGLAVGTGDAGTVAWLEFDPVTPGYRFVVGGAAGVEIATTLTAAPTAAAWATARLMTYTLTGDLTATAETLEYKPLAGPLAANELVLVRDTGRRNPANNRRRVWAERAAGGGPTGTVEVVLDVSCVGDFMRVVKGRIKADLA